MGCRVVNATMDLAPTLGKWKPLVAQGRVDRLIMRIPRIISVCAVLTRTYPLCLTRAADVRITAWREASTGGSMTNVHAVVPMEGHRNCAISLS
jgi:hypothetical protein